VAKATKYDEMPRVFVSGCYDILHDGHVQFFKDAKLLGDELIVSVATDAVLMACKGRRPSLPMASKIALISAIRHVDKVIPSSNVDPILDFRDSFRRERADILAVTTDDPHIEEKTKFCCECGAQLVAIHKRSVANPTSTTKVLARICGRTDVPLRVDFAGGWLDVPDFAVCGGYIVNCAVQPTVTLENWPYEIGSGLGGSAAKAILEMRNGFRTELNAGVGWQDPAIIHETGLCVWRSGPEPILECKVHPDWLRGLMLLYWTGSRHNCPEIVHRPRNFRGIVGASQIARMAVEQRNVIMLSQAMRQTYDIQLAEGMTQLPDLGALSTKYLGAGHGGYALYLFETPQDRSAAQCGCTKIIEPYIAVAGAW
jgi:cytidyltransferase-like protein